MTDNKRGRSSVIVAPSRRIFLGGMVVGSTLGLSGCGLFDMLGMGELSGTKESGDGDSKVIEGSSGSVASRVQRSKQSLELKGYKSRSLTFHNTHTGENLKTTYWEDGRYVSGALSEINHLLRDHRSNDVHKIDEDLLDQLFVLNKKLDTSSPYHIISGYRSPTTNAMLRGHSRGVARNSLHMSGKAIDIRVPGRSLSSVRLAALSMYAGGVGYYPSPDFVHVDTGRVRRW